MPRLAAPVSWPPVLALLGSGLSRSLESLASQVQTKVAAGLLDSLPANQDNTQFQQEGLLGTGGSAQALSVAHCSEGCAPECSKPLD
jgi:hypothetical protein